VNEPDGFIMRRPEGIHSASWRNPYRLAAMRLREVIGDLGQFSQLPSGARLLDYGCATSPYRDLFGPTIDYVGADIAGNPEATIELKADGTVPVEGESFDVVLSTQVLEHVRDPGGYLAESRRVLKPGGYLVLTTHGIMQFHPDPVDFWRWTADGLAKAVSDGGLDVVEMRGIMGLAPTAVQLFQNATAAHVPRRARVPYIAVLQWLATQMDKRYSDESRLRDSLVLAVLARRPV
jgi:SAM-dependent methyltransferase